MKEGCGEDIASMVWERWSSFVSVDVWVSRAYVRAPSAYVRDFVHSASSRRAALLRMFRTRSRIFSAARGAALMPGITRRMWNTPT
jgi:hypothetical protein